ncbi:hypothetical protein FBQ95_16910 [Chloroflexi bacterium CFX3]|nr:hypothetical protein [Chloroflexi bacterium CFX3]
MRNFIHFEVKLGGVLFAVLLGVVTLALAMSKSAPAAKPKPEEVPPKPNPPRTVTPPIPRQPHARQQHVRQSTFEQDVLKAQRAGETAASPQNGRSSHDRDACPDQSTA